MDHKNGMRGGVDWIDLAQDMEKRRAVVSMVMNISIKRAEFLISWGTISFSTRTLLH